MQELQEMWQKRVVPYLQKRSGEIIYSATVKVCGRTESEIAEILDDLIRQNGFYTQLYNAQFAGISGT